MFKYFILHIPSGNYVSKTDIEIDTKVSWNLYARGPKRKTVWGFDVPLDSDPIEFDSKVKAKLWLRQKAFGKQKTFFTIIEVPK